MRRYDMALLLVIIVIIAVILPLNVLITVALTSFIFTALSLIWYLVKDSKDVRSE